MSLPTTTFRPPPLPEPAPMVRIVAAGETPWQPTLFRAPTLEVWRPLTAPGAASPAVTPDGQRSV